jgi:peptide/nickel transport system substrate-binding protein
MKKKEVRQAINYALDREGMAKNLLGGTVKAAYTVEPPGNPVYDPNHKWYEHNTQKAKELLTKAGYPNGFKTKLMTSVDGSGQLMPVPMAEWIQRNLKEVGIDMELQTSEWISYLANYTNGMQADVGMNQMSSGRTSPFFLAIIAHSAFKAPGGFNSGYYVNPQLDEMMNKASTATDSKVANDNWKKAEEMIMDDAAFAPVVNDSAPYVVSPRVHGFVVPAEEWYSLMSVWMDK